MTFVWLAAGAEATIPTPLWSRPFGRSSYGGAQAPVKGRTLADGTLLVVGKGGLDFPVAIRIDESGSVVSSVALDLQNAGEFAIDAFGSVVALSTTQVAKFDGKTGEPLWPAPVTVGNPSTSGATLGGIGLSPSGDVLAVIAAGTYTSGAYKIRGEDGTVLWGPVPASAEMALVVADAAGDFFVAQGDVLRKLSGASGAVLFTTSPPQAADYIRRPAALALDTAGNVVYLQAATIRQPPNSSVWQTTKLGGATGEPLWGPVTFQGTGGVTPMGLTIDGRNDVVTWGYASGSPSSSVVLKYDGGTGAALWGPVGAPATSVATDTTVSANGDVFVAGYTLSGSVRNWSATRLRGTDGGVAWGPTDLSTVDVSVVVCDSGGNPVFVRSDWRADALAASGGSSLWSTPTPGATTRDEILASAADASGAVLVLGKARGASGILWKLAKYDPDGVPAWVQTLDAGGGAPVGLAVDAMGNVAVTGTSINGTLMEWKTIRYDGATGAVIWGPITYTRSPRDTFPKAIAVDPSGNVIVTGFSNESAPGNTPSYRWWTIKYRASDGFVLWTVPDALTGASLETYPEAVAVDSAGDVFVASYLFRRPEDPYLFRAVWYVVKYRSGDGGTIWLKDYPDLMRGHIKALELDASGDVFIYGDDAGTPLIRKYAGAAGTYRWSQRPFGYAGTSTVYPIALEIDPSGDAFAFEWDYSSTTGYRWRTSKVAGTTGAVTWGPVAAAPDTMIASLAGAGLDTAGNPVLAGSFRNASGYDDWALLKYDSATGNVLWGPVLRDVGQDVPVSITTIGNDFVVTGTAGSEYETARYSEGLGITVLELPHATCSTAYDVSLVAQNGTPPYAWSVVGGALPPAISLDAGTGTLSGTATTPGSYPVTIRVTDSASVHADKAFVLEVHSAADVTIVSSPNPVCVGTSATLSVAGSFASHRWYPGGETTPSISVSPTVPTLYGVEATEAGGCVHRGSLLVPVLSGPPPQPVVTAAASVCGGSAGNAASVPDAGAGAAYSWSITNGTITSGAGTPQIVWTAGPSGFVDLSVSVTPQGCAASAPGSRRIDVDSISAPTLTEFASSLPTGGIVAGPDGRLWYTVTNGNKIGAVTTEGAVTEFPIPTASSSPRGICAGADGNLWFAEYNGNKIGRITTAGAITEFALPTASSRPSGITAGPDGNVWFSEDAGRVGRITPDGSITEFTLEPTGFTDGASPYRIATGSDGNLWVAGDIVFRVTPAGTVTEYQSWALGNTHYYHSIAAGPDGNLWMTSTQNSKTARLVPNGGITVFSAYGGALGAGPDGNLWSSAGASTLRRMTTEGVSTTFTFPTSISAQAFAIGPDGNLWIAGTKPIRAVLAPVISAPASACPAATGLVASVPDAGTGASYAWSIVNGTITSGEGTRQITFTSGSAGPLTLSLTISSAGCGIDLSKDVVVSAGPVLGTYGGASVAFGASTAVTPSAPPNYNGTSATLGVTASSGFTGTLSVDALTGVVTVGSAAPAGSYTITVTAAAGCGSTSQSFSLSVGAPPRPTAVVSGSASICPGSATPIQAALTGTGPWTVTWSDGAVQGVAAALATRSVSPSSSTTYTVTALSDAYASALSGDLTGSAAVTLRGRPATPVIAAPSSVGAYSPNRVASAAAHAGSSYAWSIAGGTITSGQGTSTISFRAGDPGTLSLSVVETDTTGCASLPGTASITILDAWASIQLYTLTPCRILDTRNPVGPLGGPALAPFETRVFAVTGVCGVPATARALTTNVTITQPGASGFLVLYPGNGSLPQTSNIAFAPGVTRANNASPRLSNDGNGTLAFTNTSAGSIHVILDVNGYLE